MLIHGFILVIVLLLSFGFTKMQPSEISITFTSYRDHLFMSKLSTALTLATSVLSTCLFSSSVFASDASSAEGFNFKDWYIGGEFGRKRQDDLCDPAFISCDSSDSAWSVFSGYEFTQNLALEFGYTDLGDYSTTSLLNTMQNKAITSMSGYELAGVVNLPVAEHVNIFTKLGAMYYDGEERSVVGSFDDKGWAGLFGLGLSYDFTQSLQARAEYNFIHDLGDREFAGDHGHLTTLGLVYRFGKNQASAPVKSAPAAVVEETVVEEVVAEPVVVAPVVIDAVQAHALFDFDKSDVKVTAELEQVAAHLVTYPQANAHLMGFTDSLGSNEYNEKLALRRANAVAAYLISQGVSESQLTIKPVGETDKFGNNTIIGERFKNRRVSIEIAEFTQ